LAETVYFNVDQFKSQLSGGGARPNQFFVQLTFPAFVTLGPLAIQSSPFLVTAASMPGSIVNPAMVMYRGREVKFAGERTFNPWTVNIINDNTFGLRNALEDWMNKINDLQDNSGEIQPAKYQSDMVVTQLDRNNVPLKFYQIRDAFPIDVSEVQLDFGANDQISQFSCTFAYQDFKTSLVPLGGAVTGG
jgi:hypothetical protein